MNDSEEPAHRVRRTAGADRGGGARQVGRGVEVTATGIGKTVAGGAETAGERIKEAKSAWTRTKEGAVSFGHRVKSYNPQTSTQ